jgi:type II secretory pathway pseudopilin PulG
MHGTTGGVDEGQRGFTLIDTIVALSIAGLALLAVATLRGAHPPERRLAAVALQGALAETRALATADADTTVAMPSGATLTAVPLSGGGTLVSVFASRPIPGAPPLSKDRGFPPLALPVSIAIPGSTVAGQPFAILVSSSGYASIAGNYAYDPARPVALASDPGCDEASGVTIAIADDATSETHAFDCRSAQYEADVELAGSRRAL